MKICIKEHMDKDNWYAYFELEASKRTNLLDYSQSCPFDPTDKARHKKLRSHLAKHLKTFPPFTLHATSQPLLGTVSSAINLTSRLFSCGKSKAAGEPHPLGIFFIYFFCTWQQNTFNNVRKTHKNALFLSSALLAALRFNLFN